MTYITLYLPSPVALRYVRYIIAVSYLLLGALLLPSAAQGQAPNWTVNPAAFQSNMSVTAVLNLNGTPSHDPDDLVAAFAPDGAVRGVIAPSNVSGSQVFFLTVHADGEGETISFKAYVAEADQVVDISETITFTANGTVGTLNDPFVWNASGVATCPAGPPNWTVNPAAFQSNMSVTAAVAVGGVPTASTNDQLAAFAGDEVRGVAGPTEVSGELVFFLTTYADASGEVITFKYYDQVANLIRTVGETLTFSANAIHGSPSAPFEMAASCDAMPTAVEAEAPPALAALLPAYPNPFHHTTTLRYTLDQPAFVQVSLFDMLGRRVQTVVAALQPAGTHTATVAPKGLPGGLYLYRVEAAGVFHTGRVVYLP